MDTVRVTADRIGCDRFGCDRPIKAGEDLRVIGTKHLCEWKKGTGPCTGYDQDSLTAIGRDYVLHVTANGPAPALRPRWADRETAEQADALANLATIAASLGLGADATLAQITAALATAKNGGPVTSAGRTRKPSRN